MLFEMKFGSQTTILSCYCLFLFTLTTAIGRSNTQYTSNQSYRTCATNQDVFFAIKNDCTKFVRCFNGFRYDFTCPEGTVFDKVRKICNHPRKVRGKCSRLEKARECTDENDLTPYPGDCVKFIRCANGILYVFECPYGTVFDPILRLCNYVDNLRAPCGVNHYFKVQY